MSESIMNKMMSLDFFFFRTIYEAQKYPEASGPEQTTKNENYLNETSTYKLHRFKTQLPRSESAIQ